jgi:nitrogenase-stabilizing/protective protein
VIPELEGVAEAEEFFEALGVPFDPGVLASHRLAILKLFGLAAESWLDANAGAGGAARRAALARSLCEAHAAFTGDEREPACSPFGASRLVRIGRGR